MDHVGREGCNAGAARPLVHTFSMTDEILVPPVPPETKTDVLGHPWQAETIALPPDAEGEVVATLVSRHAAHPPSAPYCTCTGSRTTSSRPSTASGGSSATTTCMRSTCASTAGPSVTTRLRPTSLTWREYFAELDLAWQRITERDGHYAGRPVRPTRPADSLDRALGRRASAGGARRRRPQLALARPPGQGVVAHLAGERGARPGRPVAAVLGSSRARSAVHGV